jgi:hypothetical protein
MAAAPANSKLMTYVTASLIEPPHPVSNFINPDGKVSVVMNKSDKQISYYLQSLLKKSQRLILPKLQLGVQAYENLRTVLTVSERFESFYLNR